MKNLTNIVLASLILAACGELPSVDKPTPTPAPAPTPTPAPAPTPVDLVQQDIDLIIREENKVRFSLGQSALTRGLSCSVVKINSGTCLYSAPISSTCTGSPGTPNGTLNTTGNPTNTFRYYGTFTQETPTHYSTPNPILPPSLGLVYVSEKYRIICSGVLVVRESDYYDFTVKSVDAAVLTVNNTILVNHDNAHGMSQKLGTIFLRRGVVPFKIEYAQTGGFFGLSIKAGGEPIESRFFYQ
jgi:hypothetical protein